MNSIGTSLREWFCCFQGKPNHSNPHSHPQSLFLNSIERIGEQPVSTNRSLHEKMVKTLTTSRKNPLKKLPHQHTALLISPVQKAKAQQFIKRLKVKKKYIKKGELSFAGMLNDSKLRNNPDVEIKKSMLLENAPIPEERKMGLYTKKHIFAGDIILEYFGDEYLYAEVETKGDGDYAYVYILDRTNVVDVEKASIINAKTKEGEITCQAAYINHSMTPITQFQEVNDSNGHIRVLVVAQSEIKKGTELTIHYGDEYRKELEDSGAMTDVSSADVRTTRSTARQDSRLQAAVNSMAMKSGLGTKLWPGYDY